MSDQIETGWDATEGEEGLRNALRRLLVAIALHDEERHTRISFLDCLDSLCVEARTEARRHLPTEMGG